MVVIRPVGSLVSLESIRICSVFALFPPRHPPFPSSPSCEVSKLQLNLRWAGKRKLLFFRTKILDVCSWFDSKGGPSESVRPTGEERHTRECTWFKSTFCQSLDTPHIFGLRGSPPHARVVCCLKLFHFSLPDPLTSCFVCWGKSEVVWSNTLIPPPPPPLLQPSGPALLNTLQHGQRKTHIRSQSQNQDRS